MPVRTEAEKRAQQLDERLSKEASEIVALSPTQLFQKTRHYLQQQADAQNKIRNNVYGLITLRNDHEDAVIELGPLIDKGQTENHFKFESGARLSFGITTRQEGKGSLLIAYRFHLHLGARDVRIPIPVLCPLGMLDRIFFVVEPSFRKIDME